MKQSFPERHPLIWLYLFFLYFSGSFQLLLYVTGVTGFKGLREAILMGVLGVIPVLLFPSKTRLLAGLLGLLMLVGAITSLAYWFIYGQEFSQSTIFIIFESNAAESMEFVTSYLRWWQPLVLLGFCLIPFLMWQKIKPLKASPRYRYNLALVFSIIALWPFISTTIIKGRGVDNGIYHQMVRMEPVAPWNLVMGYVKYRQQLAAMQNLLTGNQQLAPLENFSEQDSEVAKTFVLVIGESTNRQRMSLYGYPRKTTPKLDAMANELVVFDDVVTPRPYTVEALQQILSFADSKHTDDFFNKPNLLNMMKQAGYEITWITNQQTQTKRNTMLTTLSQLADKQVYLNNNRNQNARQYDDVVLEPFQAALASEAKKKLIVVHLLGTHRGYSYRYPESYARFTHSEGVPPWVTEDYVDEYNSYDNAVLFNDSVVTAIINSLKAQGGYSLLSYFSDHGEEVFDTPDALFTGRDEANPKPAMYTVPFLLWPSAEYKAVNHTLDWQSYTARPYSTADFIYTWAELAGINFDGMDVTRSLVSRNYMARPRWVGNPDNPNALQDYDNLTTRPSLAEKSGKGAAIEHLPRAAL